MDREGINSSIESLNRRLGHNTLLRAMNPVNLGEERERSLEDPRHNPIFYYEEFPSHFILEQDISALRPRIEDSIEDLERDVDLALMDYFLTNKYCIDARGTGRIQEATERAFGRPEACDIVWGRENYRIEVPEEETPVDPSTIRRFGYLYLASMPEIEGEYEIKLEPSRVGIHADPESGKPKFPGKRSVSWEKLAGDLAHEFGRHILEYEIGKRQPFPAFWTGFPHRAFTSEGHAMYIEDLVVPGYPPRTKARAGRIVAMHMAGEHSFSDIYNELLGAGFTKPEAFRCAFNAKRGLGDTGEKGASFGGNIYVLGYRKVREYLNANGDESLLYTGRISLDYIDRIKNLKGLYRPPGDLPQRIRKLAVSILK
jgi:hypothetical protein